MVQKTHKHRPCISLPGLPFKYKYRITARYPTLDEKHAFASLAISDIQYLIMTRYACNFVPMYKSYIETKHENRDRLGPSEMG